METGAASKLRVLVLGSGGREHALAWKLAQSPRLDSLYAMPGNPGFLSLGATLLEGDVMDFEAVKQAVLEQEIDLVVVGAEAPLCAGIVDFFQNDEALKKVSIFGPTKACATLESSKAFAKEFMQQHAIPTAKSVAFTAENQQYGLDFLVLLPPPYVIKADGLAAGKGVLIVPELSEAFVAIRECFEGKFGEAGKTVVVEEFLPGIEFSLFAICDGKNFEVLPVAKDYKRAFDKDEGLNTGGMGSVTPLPYITPEVLLTVKDTVLRPTLEGMEKAGTPYTGFLFVGMMLSKSGTPKVIEYNVRMGDPETQVVMLALEGDLLTVLYDAANHNLTPGLLSTSVDTFVSVSLVSGGYPEAYEKGKLITGVEDSVAGTTIFHAGTALDAQGNLRTAGGRVFSVCARGKDLATARDLAYARAEKITFEGKRNRMDIGEDIAQFAPQQS